MNGISNYFKQIHNARHFLFHLVNWDIKYKFRRSKLGVLWTVLQPLLLTLIIALVFGFVFRQEMATYAPYILSGVLAWDVILGAVVPNSNSFLQAETYIKQFSHPIAIYPLRMALVSITTFLIAISGLFIWILFVYPENLAIALVSLPLTMFLYFCVSWPISIISSHVNVRYRDYPYVMGLLMQLLWYLSPVFFRESMFKTNGVLYRFFLINPVTQLLSLVRQPFLYGRFADGWAYLYVAVLCLILFAIAWIVNSKAEKTVIYYL